MLLVEKYDFLTILLSKSKIDLDKNPESLNGLPVSDNFKANIWRLAAIFLLKEAKRRMKSSISSRDLICATKRLEFAEKFFEKDESDWGLGLTYTHLARICTFKNNLKLNSAKIYFEKAIEKFKKIHHYRGTFLTLKDLHDLYHD
jgi:hypothetical protein